MLAYTPLDEKSLALLLGYLHDFLKYLAKNAASLFTASDYKVASAEYHRKALWGSTDHSPLCLVSVNTLFVLSLFLVRLMFFPIVNVQQGLCFSCFLFCSKQKMKGVRAPFLISELLPVYAVIRQRRTFSRTFSCLVDNIAWMLVVLSLWHYTIF